MEYTTEDDGPSEVAEDADGVDCVVEGGIEDDCVNNLVEDGGLIDCVVVVATEEDVEIDVL